jgi:hypothetical protein
LRLVHVVIADVSGDEAYDNGDDDDGDTHGMGFSCCMAC